MSIIGSWAIGYLYLGTSTPLNATMTITSEDPLDGSCRIGNNLAMKFTAGAVVSVFDQQWLWFNCADHHGNNFFFNGRIDPDGTTISGGCTVPIVSQTEATDCDTTGTGTDPGDLGGWVATHQ